jgi:hypothetical protein
MQFDRSHQLTELISLKRECVADIAPLVPDQMGNLREKVLGAFARRLRKAPVRALLGGKCGAKRVGLRAWCRGDPRLRGLVGGKCAADLRIHHCGFSIYDHNERVRAPRWKNQNASRNSQVFLDGEIYQ